MTEIPAQLKELDRDLAELRKLRESGRVWKDPDATERQLVQAFPVALLALARSDNPAEAGAGSQPPSSRSTRRCGLSAAQGFRWEPPWRG